MLGYRVPRVRSFAGRPDEYDSLDRGGQLNQFSGDLRYLGLLLVPPNAEKRPEPEYGLVKLPKGVATVTSPRTV